MAELSNTLPRLLLALLCGVCVGLNRNLHHKAAGFRTFGLVSVGAALITLVMEHLSPTDISAVSRVAQGIVTGIGFLGAGVILHRESGHRHQVSGLTTAAAIWATASLGIACGLGLYVIALPALALIMLVLMAGGPIERHFERLANEKRLREQPPDQNNTP